MFLFKIYSYCEKLTTAIYVTKIIFHDGLIVKSSEAEEPEFGKKGRDNCPQRHLYGFQGLDPEDEGVNLTIPPPPLKVSAKP